MTSFVRAQDHRLLLEVEGFNWCEESSTSHSRGQGRRDYSTQSAATGCYARFDLAYRYLSVASGRYARGTVSSMCDYYANLLQMNLHHKTDPFAITGNFVFAGNAKFL